MKHALFDCFRVWPDGRVDDRLNVKVLDHVGYVPTGGTDLPYISLDDELLAIAQREGGLRRAAVVSTSQKRLRLTASPLSESLVFEEQHALVLLPARSVFNFRYANKPGPVRGVATYSPDNLALLVLMAEGDIIEAHAIVHRLQDQQLGFTISFDGGTVLVQHLAAAA